MKTPTLDEIVEQIAEAAEKPPEVWLSPERSEALNREYLATEFDLAARLRNFGISYEVHMKPVVAVLGVPIRIKGATSLAIWPHGELAPMPACLDDAH